MVTWLILGLIYKEHIIMKKIGQVKPILLYLIMPLSVLTEVAYSTALPQIARQLNIAGSIVQLSSSIYFLGFAFGIFTLGQISDIFGRRPIMLLGIIIYLFTTLLISLSTQIEYFIIMRFFQAYGASVASVLTQSMSRDSYRGQELSYIFLSTAIISACLPSIGSMIGSYIVNYYGDWRYIFRFLILFASILLIICLKFLPETNPYIGSATRHRFSYVFKTMLTDRKLLAYAFIVGSYNGTAFGFYIQAPFIFLERLGMNQTLYGNFFLIFSLVNLIGALICRKLIKRSIDIYQIKLAGLNFSLLAAILLIIGSYITYNSLSINLHLFWIIVPMSINFFGQVSSVPLILRSALEDYRKVTGAAGSIFGALYYLITALITFLISAFHSDTINNYAYLQLILTLINLVLFLLIKYKWQNKNAEFGLS